MTSPRASICSAVNQRVWRLALSSPRWCSPQSTTYLTCVLEITRRRHPPLPTLVTRSKPLWVVCVVVPGPKPPVCRTTAFSRLCQEQAGNGAPPRPGNSGLPWFYWGAVRGTRKGAQGTRKWTLAPQKWQRGQPGSQRVAILCGSLPSSGA